MYRVPPDRAWWPAVGAPLERVVRPHSLACAQCHYTDTNIVTGQLTVYDKPPDRAAGQYLIDRIMGKPIDRQELGGPGGAPIEMTVREVIVRLNDQPL